MNALVRTEDYDRQQARMLLAAAYHLLLGDRVPPARLSDAHDALCDAGVILAKLLDQRENRAA